MANFIILGPHQSFLISRFPVGSSRPHIRTVTTLTSLGYYIHLSRTQHQQYINELPFEPFLLISSYLPLVIVLRPYFRCHSLAVAFMQLWFHIFCIMLYESRVRSKLEHVHCESSTYERRGSYPKETETFSEPLHQSLVYRHFNKHTDPHIRSFHQCTPETCRLRRLSDLTLHINHEWNNSKTLPTNLTLPSLFLVESLKKFPHLKCFLFHTGI